MKAANLGINSVIVANAAGSVTSSNAVLGLTIQFTIAFTNQYVNLTNAPLSLAIQSGVPYYWAVLLDNTNFGGASWTAYTSSNITANLGTVQGWHTVWVGLSGRPAGSQAAWNAVRLDLDLTAPILTVTNALNVTIPMIQLQGYANEELAWLTYDLNNANGSVSNQPGFMTGAIFDTNSFTYTNDAFKCFDLVLASGANTVTLHAADLAGNLTTSNFVFNLNYSNKPAPVVQLWWPQNGAQISGSSFTWRGTVDDPTVTLSAQITDTNGDVNVVAGVIERNGNFWVDNLPLAPGTNWLTLTATDINNHVTSTNIYVVQSSVGLSITTSDAITTQTAIGVSGTIGASGYLVWVNGVLANQSGGNWTAYNVPVNGDGVQVIQVCAIPNTPADNYGYGTGSGGGGTNSSLSNPGNPFARDAVCAEYNPEKEPIIICVGYHQSWSGQGGITNNYWQSSETINWSPTGGGSIVSNYSLTYYSDWLTSQTQSQWDSNGVGSTVTTSTGFVNGVTNNPTPITNAYDGPTSFGGLQGQTYGMDAGSGSPAATGTENISSDYLLYVRGEGVPGWQRLLAQSVNAQQVMDPWYPAMQESWDSYEGDPFYWAISSTPVPYSQQTMLGVPEDSDGNAFVVVPCGAVMNPQPKVLGNSDAQISPASTNYKLIFRCNAFVPVQQVRTNIGVGENVTIYFTPNIPTNSTWGASAGSLLMTNGPTTLFTAPSNATNATVTATLPNGQSKSITFNVIAPSGFSPAVITNTYPSTIPQGQPGAEMDVTMFLLPTNVSFAAVQLMEVSNNAVNISNYFANTNIFTNAPYQLRHQSAGFWWDVSSDNSSCDSVGILPQILLPPWSAGSCQWIIPTQWRVGSNGGNNNLLSNTATFSIDGSGTVTVSRWGRSITRTTNNAIMTNNP